MRKVGSDLHKPDVYGVGVFGDGPYKAKDVSTDRMYRRYSVWFKMISRCYNTNDKSYKFYGEKGVTVCSEWLNYQIFSEWYETNYISGELDKDILGDGLIYSPDSCSFIPQSINKLLHTKCNMTTRDLPLGVTPYRDKYRATCSNPITKKQKSIGSYPTPDLAFSAYKSYKEGLIKQLADKHYQDGSITEQVYESLMKWEVVPYPK